MHFCFGVIFIKLSCGLILITRVVVSHSSFTFITIFKSTVLFHKKNACPKLVYRTQSSVETASIRKLRPLSILCSRVVAYLRPGIRIECSDNAPILLLMCSDEILIYEFYRRWNKSLVKAATVIPVITPTITWFMVLLIVLTNALRVSSSNDWTSGFSWTAQMTPPSS